ncbi:5-dehydro-4-deoxy-D-glucuronate isomerase [Lentisphaera marina]|uniref:5-dehydro-4-deoxy-D-glucuronate isomerase n=1 Tax=Lentisphaera marina TaxID=1111041 RepID=UPI00236735B1|nr:5-dehydro-4-deoxy-D-glucuronate isomerase [Lentisphaera marina]MDD7987445.1 5-dehydro-4-deoxy-D-glucuronate isomerase [Lentisphaera marina]
MKSRYTVGINEYKRMCTEELRSTFLLDNMFQEGQSELVYCEVDRTVVGGFLPTLAPLKLEAGKELAAEYFCQRREAGVINLGAPGKVIVDGKEYEMNNIDCLYIGRGSKDVSFESVDPKNPAYFHLVSYPAHTEYPTTLATQNDANPVQMGSLEDSNHRTIYQYIHANGGIKSCQLVMGVTVLEPGSVWNTMKPHTHERRSEVYTYFNLNEDSAVFHMMGSAEETRHIITRDKETVVSPSWSLHSGAGTCAYSFVWGMGGENQEFTDMDHIEVKELK